MKSDLFKEKLLCALDFVKQHHESCQFAVVTVGNLRYVFFIVPFEVDIPGQDLSVCYRVCVRTNLVVTNYHDSNVFVKDDKLIVLQSAYIPVSEAYSVFESFNRLSIISDYDVK